MMLKGVYTAVFLMAIMALAVSCHNTNSNQDKKQLDIAAVDSVLKNNDSLFSGTYSHARIQKLLSHFAGDMPPGKNPTKLPFVVDSIYMANVSKGHDSLGTKEVKMLIRLWHDDDLLESDSNQILDFYKIDSLKAHHAFTGHYKEGMPTYANAYSLQQIWMREETLLIWALVSKQEDADPVYRLTTIYYTILNNNTILETGIMGRLMTGADPPGEYQTVFSSTLTSDGKLIMDENESSDDIDSLTGEIKHTRYEYLIHQGYTQLQNKKKDAPVEFKMKSDK